MERVPFKKVSDYQEIVWQFYTSRLFLSVNDGEQAFIPRTDLVQSDTNLTFIFKRQTVINKYHHLLQKVEGDKGTKNESTNN
jgi:hypothetical protein